MEELLHIKNEVSSRIHDIVTQAELEELRTEIVGKNGKLTFAMKQITKLPLEERPTMGRLANEVKIAIETLIEQKKKELSGVSAKKRTRFFDVTEPGHRPPLGHLHLVTQAIDEITAIFERIGFTRRSYPEVEWDHYAFGALNFPADHPARDDWETFFIDEDPHSKYGPMLLTPHTSSGQIREMERRKPPIKMINIAKCYRRQADISHTPMFHQFETLCVGKNISITHLKGVLDYFAKSYFGPQRRTRIRPYQFQFTEPSFEVDISCGVCFGKRVLKDGTKCRLCKGGWLELGGAGIVHPNVLKSTGIDPHEYTGFASGWGVERVLMMKEGLHIDDLRLLYSNNIDFLEQF